MGVLGVAVRAEGGERLAKLSRDLKAAGERGRGLRREMRRNIREAAKPAVADVRRAVMAVQVTSTRSGHARPDSSTGLRARVAKATSVSVTATGVKIKVSGRKLGPGQRKLARYLDAELQSYKNWRHPVFGNRENWTVQHGQPFFFVTLRKHTRDFRRAVDEAMQETAERIARG